MKESINGALQFEDINFIIGQDQHKEWQSPLQMRFPEELNPEDPNVLFDLSGNGALDSFTMEPTRAGFYPNLGDGKFGRKISFDSIPTLDFTDQNVRGGIPAS